jgi:hypothetical protein
MAEGGRVRFVFRGFWEAIGSLGAACAPKKEELVLEDSCPSLGAPSLLCDTSDALRCLTLSDISSQIFDHVSVIKKYEFGDYEFLQGSLLPRICI